MSDQPGTSAPWKTPDGQGKLDYHDGKDEFTAWMIVREKAGNNDNIQYLNWASWEVDWGVTTKYASNDEKTVDKITGKTENTGSGPGEGTDKAKLDGQYPNAVKKSEWS